MSNGTVNFAGDTGKSLKRANRLASDFLSFLLSSLTLSQASTILTEAITTIQTCKKQHKSLDFALTTYRYH